MLIFLIILIILDALALYLIWNRIDGGEQVEFLIGYCSRKTVIESIISIVVVMIYLVATIPFNIANLFKK